MEKETKNVEAELQAKLLAPATQKDLLELEERLARTAPSKPALTVREHPQYTRYFTLREKGVPMEEIRSEMLRRKLNFELLETPDAPAPPPPIVVFIREGAETFYTSGGLGMTEIPQPTDTQNLMENGFIDPQCHPSFPPPARTYHTTEWQTIADQYWGKMSGGEFNEQVLGGSCS